MIKTLRAGSISSTAHTTSNRPATPSHTHAMPRPPYAAGAGAGSAAKAWLRTSRA